MDDAVEGGGLPLEVGRARARGGHGAGLVSGVGEVGWCERTDLGG